MRTMLLILAAVAVVTIAGPSLVDFIGKAIDRSMAYEEARLESSLPADRRAEVMGR